MLYQWYELSHAAVKPARAAADSYRLFFENPLNPMSHTAVGRSAAAACQVFERGTRQYKKPEFGISTTQVDGSEVAVREEIAWQRPFCQLIHFKRDIAQTRAEEDPKILLVAPMSGHYATLLRGTVEALLPHHEVFITDWQNASEVPKAAGSFDLDDYIDYMCDQFRHFGGDIHVVAVCQPSVAVLAAVAVMEAARDADAPASMTLMGGPVDTRVSKTAVNDLAEKRGTQWFASNVIGRVPWTSPGYGRQVYPGFLQLSGFMSMNLDRHMKAQKDMFVHLVRGDGDGAEKHREFYDEYLAVMDLTSEFFLQTIDSVFVRHELPKGEMMHRGAHIDLSAITGVALMTVEGEKDDITGIGQCAAAIDLCDRLASSMKTHYECPAVGHYGIFNGRRFRNQIAPRIARFVRKHDARADTSHKLPPIGPDEPARRKIGSVAAPSHSAFAFSPTGGRNMLPANDAAPDRLAQKVKASGLGAIGAKPRRQSTSHALAMQALTWRLWGLASMQPIRYLATLMPGRQTHRDYSRRPNTAPKPNAPAE